MRDNVVGALDVSGLGHRGGPQPRRHRHRAGLRRHQGLADVPGRLLADDVQRLPADQHVAGQEQRQRRHRPRHQRLRRARRRRRRPPPPPAAPAAPTITAGPSGSTTATSASFAFTTDDSAATFTCSLDSAAFASCSSPKAYSSLATGSHTFAVKATNGAGTSAATSRTWTITAPPAAAADTTAPDTTISSGPDRHHARQHAHLRVHRRPRRARSPAASTAAPGAACTSPWTTAALSDGAHTVAVRATDAAGNTDASPGDAVADRRHDRADARRSPRPRTRRRRAPAPRWPSRPTTPARTFAVRVRRRRVRRVHEPVDAERPGPRPAHRCASGRPTRPATSSPRRRAPRGSSRRRRSSTRRRHRRRPRP